MTTTTKRDELRQRVLAKKGKRSFAKVETSDGDEYWIRSLTQREKAENDILPVNKKTGGVETDRLSRQQCDLLCLSVVIENGSNETLFDPSEWKEWQEIPSPITTKLLQAIEKLNAGEDVEGLVKN